MEDIYKNGKILLISDMIEDYKTLKRLGFKNILFMRSMRDADSYFTDNLEELDECFIIVLGFQSDFKSLMNRNISLPNDIKSLKGRKYFYEAPNKRMPFPWFLELYIKVPEDKLDEEWIVDNKSLKSIIWDCMDYLGYEKLDLPLEEVPKIVKKPEEKIIINEKEIFENIKRMAIKYLRCKNNGYALAKDINVYEDNFNIRIEYMIDGFVIGAITFPQEELYDEEFIDIELVNNKGRLVKNEVGIYPVDYDNITIRRVNGNELNLLKIIESKLFDYMQFLKTSRPYVRKNRL